LSLHRNLLFRTIQPCFSGIINSGLKVSNNNKKHQTKSLENLSAHFE
jgi:hypothetical protein